MYCKLIYYNIIITFFNLCTICSFKVIFLFKFCLIYKTRILSINSYRIILCSIGVGRTGVFIALSIILERMRYEGVVDMYQTVKMLRTQRPAMIQSEVRGVKVLFKLI